MKIILFQLLIESIKKIDAIGLMKKLDSLGKKI